jgi:hypothetical protein
LFFLTFNSCTSTSTRGQLYFVDPRTGSFTKNNEPNVKARLEEILCNPEQYKISVFERTPLRWQKRTDLWHHKFYVIINSDMEYHTLSFYGTLFAFYSDGAWAWDTDYDLIPFSLYLDGINDYSILEIRASDKVDMVETLKNIIEKMDDSINGRITYYLLDHVKNKENKRNCNTSVAETLVLWASDKVDMVETLKNIIEKMEDSINDRITYYLLDHVKE